MNETFDRADCHNCCDNCKDAENLISYDLTKYAKDTIQLGTNSCCSIFLTYSQIIEFGGNL